MKKLANKWLCDIILLLIIIVGTILLLSTTKEISVSVDGEAVEMGSTVLRKQGVYYCPISFFADSMGYELNWDEPTRKLTFKKENEEITMHVGDKEYTKNGEIYTMDYKIFSKGSRTYIAANDIADIFGYDFLWDQDNKTLCFMSKTTD